MSQHRTQEIEGVQVEVREEGYRQHRENPLVEVRVWESLSESYLLVFEEVDPARGTLAPSGSFIGRIPAPVITALGNLGYQFVE